jgi:hypothetical protein
MLALALPTAQGQTEDSATSAPRILPANTTITLEFQERLVSGVSAKGATFKMQVAWDVRIDDAVVIPRGTPAVGEIIDSKKAGILGKAGVLVLSARFIHLEQRDVRLHSALLDSVGDTRYALASVIPFVMGDKATVEVGTLVKARTARDESF